MKRLTIIDEAQKKITELSSHVISLQYVLVDKRSRGAFGEVQLANLIANMIPPNHYQMQYTLSNGKRADCILFLPDPSGDLVIDAKFPLETYQKLITIEMGNVERKQLQQQFPPFRDCLPLVRFRAQAMQDAVPVGVGAMAAILGLEADAVRAGCRQATEATGEVVEPANFNDPKQTVIAGTKAGVDRACELLKAAGAKRALPLAVSAPFHSSLMKPAAERLRERLADVSLSAPRFPVINNIDVESPSDPAAIRDALYRQAFGAVRWVEVVAALRARGLSHVFECGPGKVLAGLVKRVDGELISTTVLDPAGLGDAKGMLQ